MTEISCNRKVCKHNVIRREVCKLATIKIETQNFTDGKWWSCETSSCVSFEEREKRNKSHGDKQ
ncbi:MAG: hypothetical protein KAS32_08020 [Candidatus Peribacteraceae bacterium]|nr:hypothetical protein [Candidatus Peribacteraceae bacterium]